MQQPTKQTFGLLIAYVIPGAVLLFGLSTILEVASWIVSAGGEPSIGGFLYSTLASIGLGMTVSAARWLTLDSLHHATGIKKPDWDFARLTCNVEAFSLLVEHHYRYYQFYSNTLLAVLVAYPAFRLWGNQAVSPAVDLAIVLLETVYFVASRDALYRYYNRVGELMPERP